MRVAAKGQDHGVVKRALAATARGPVLDGAFFRLAKICFFNSNQLAAPLL